MEIDLKTDSRKVRPGDTFIAIRNVNRDGHDYIPMAIANGAVKVIVEEGEYEVETEVVKDTRQYLKDYLYHHYYPVFKDMKLIGVTGTNGKTTIGYLIYQILTMLDHPCAYMGTIGFYYNGQFLPMVNTTPDVDVLYDCFLKAKEAGCKILVMEVSSHALAKDRIYGLEFDEVAFTNLTQDHLDYHKTMDHYAASKQLLFKKTRGHKIAVINGDDPHADYFCLENNHNIVISDHDGDLIVNDIEFSHLGTSFAFSYLGKTYHTHIQMVGRYNVYNYLTAMLLVHHLGYSIEQLLSLNDRLKAPKGRMELIVYRTNGIFVDYAHTPDAVENVLNSALEFKKGKIITIVGCGGDRDATKRPVMGQIACKKSDLVIITNDNPRTEDPQKIIDDILKGIDSDHYVVIPDRKEAIAYGMSQLKENDIFMILGKGHEDYQIIGHEKIHFSDQEEVEKYMKEHSNDENSVF
ncbi:MAG: UDP-N-acetylmuramoyl-L-alanyl-D-glutamate--2,6-diaminopimelate ligase [Faecalibacillus sp.]